MKPYGITYHHGADGRVVRKVFEDRAWTELLGQHFSTLYIDYDPLGRVKRLRWGDAPPAEEFSYDPMGNPTQATRIDPWGAW